VTDPPKVSVRVGPPVALGLVDPEIDSEHIMSAIVDLLPPEAHEWHEPTAEELAATMPSNVDEAAVAAEHEAGRRPGVD
jgi:putative phosphoserine phosphatase/1-acylglycerol-3-phosphate O-acyltransferase